MKHSAKSLFLLDGMGAFTSAILLSQVLARYESFFGMPKNVLYILSGVACCFGLYSISCYLLLKDNFKSYLTGIITANTLYCVATLALVLYYFQALTWLGMAYFAGEILIVSMLVFFELRRVRVGILKV